MISVTSSAEKPFWDVRDGIIGRGEGRRGL